MPQPSWGTSDGFAFVVVDRASRAPAGTGQSAATSATAAPTVLASSSGFYVDPNGPAPSQVHTWLAEGRTADAQQLRKLAGQPVPLWASGPGPGHRPGARLRRRRHPGSAAAAAGALQHPRAGLRAVLRRGASDAGHYRAWVGKLLGGLAARPVTVIVEPDAVADEIKGCGREAGHRPPALLAETVERLKDAGPVQVYLDAGNPGFVADPGQVADALHRSGVAKAERVQLERVQLPHHGGKHRLRHRDLHQARRRSVRDRHQPKRQRPAEGGRRRRAILLQPARRRRCSPADAADRPKLMTTPVR